MAAGEAEQLAGCGHMGVVGTVVRSKNALQLKGAAATQHRTGVAMGDAGPGLPDLRSLKRLQKPTFSLTHNLYFLKM